MGKKGKGKGGGGGKKGKGKGSKASSGFGEYDLHTQQMERRAAIDASDSLTEEMCGSHKGESSGARRSRLDRLSRND